MDTYLIGAAIPLAARITRNGRAFSGRLVQVRVIDIQTGAELLALTTLAETPEAGLYSYTWGLAPSTPRQMAVIYLVDGFEEGTEYVQTSTSLADTQSNATLEAVLDLSELEGTTIEEDLQGAVDEEELQGQASTEESVASLDDEELTGEATC